MWRCPPASGTPFIGRPRAKKKSRGPTEEGRPKQNFLVYPRTSPHRQADAIMSAASSTLERDPELIDAKGRDIIIDFELVGDNDTINVHDIDANTALAGNQNFVLSHYSEANGSGPVNTAMWVNQPQSIHADTKNDVLYANVDNDAAPELAIQIPGL